MKWHGMLMKGALWLPLLCMVCIISQAWASSAGNQYIAHLIFQNECAGKQACLTSWNEGEGFASLGMGHFIWYPDVELSAKKFNESFPQWLAWLKGQGVNMPAWLGAQKACPWANRNAFLAAQQTPKMIELRQFLLKTRDFQVKFIKNRLKNALPDMLQSVPDDQRQHIAQQFEYMAASPMGFYALMDYVNFKGEGTDIRERYQGQGWGLLQVLSAMHSQSSGVQTIADFSSHAAMILTRRVTLSPPKRHEQRWLAGWKKRLRTYVREANQAH